MSDLTFPLIGLTTLAGYFFSRDGRNPRIQETVREGIEEFDKPNGKNIYTSNVVNESNDEILKRSLQNYKKSENPSESGYIPPLFNTYSAVGNESLLSPTLVPDIAGMTSQQLSKLNDINRLENVIKPKSESDKSVTIDNRPMFKPIGKYLGQDVNAEVLLDTSLPYKQTSINLLTGKPFDASHNNMVPFFGSNTKQNIETFSNEALLDQHTGNVSTFSHKKEISSLYDKTPENIYGNPVFSSQVNMDRYVPSLYRQNERPVEPEKISAPIAGTFENTIRPSFKDVNELRPGNRPKETYKGRVLSGKMGENRGVMGEVEKNRPDTYFENNHRFSGPGEFVGPKSREDYSINMKASSRQSYNMEYYGGQDSIHKATKQRLSNVDNSDQLAGYFQDPKRHNFTNDFGRNLSGTIVNNQSGHDYGKSGFQVFESERATTGDKTHVLNMNMQSSGVKIKPQDETRTTIRETLRNADNSGNINTSFNVGSNATYNAGISNITARQTHKETLVDNKYKGQAHINDGMGYLVNKHEAKITGKEIITEVSKDYITNAAKIVKNHTVQSTYANPEKVRNAIHPEYKGNAKFASEAESRVRFDNVTIRDQKQESLMGQRPSGPQNFQISSGKDSFADIKVTDNMLLKEEIDDREKIINDYKHIPNKDQLGIPIRHRDDNDAMDTVVADRLQPDLVHGQLQNNPYFINTSKHI
jgi:hypothetical protein